MCVYVRVCMFVCVYLKGLRRRWFIKLMRKSIFEVFRGGLIVKYLEWEGEVLNDVFVVRI